MSLPMKDVRTKLPIDIWAEVKGLAVGFEKDESEIVRGIVTEYINRLIHARSVADAAKKLEGM